MSGVAGRPTIGEEHAVGGADAELHLGPAEVEPDVQARVFT